jgi:hypothetical protein
MNLNGKNIIDAPSIAPESGALAADSGAVI